MLVQKGNPKYPGSNEEKSRYQPGRQVILSAFNLYSILFVFLMLVILQQCVFAQKDDGMHDRWLIMQRQYPAGFITQDAYTFASRHQGQNNFVMGFYSPDPWQSIGPTISGSGAGRVTCVKYDPKYNSIKRPYIYVTGHNGGVWKSTNAGVSFSPVSDALPCQSSGVICIDPNNSDIIFYGSGGTVEAFMYNYYGLGVFKSTDAGNTWSGGYNVHYPKGTYSYDMVVNPDIDHSNMVYLAERTGLYISSDAGVTWNPANDISYGSCQGVATSIDGSKVYAIGGFNGMFWPPGYPGIGYWMSTNYGNNWFQPAGVFTPVTRTHISVSHANDSYVYSLTRTGSELHAYVSTDGGYSFPRFYNFGSGYGSMSADFMFIEASPHDAQVAFVGYGTGYMGLLLWKTTDGGQSWTLLYTPGADENCLDFNPNPGYPEEILLGYDQGLSRSTNLGGSWEDLNNTLSLTELYKLSSYYHTNLNLIMGAVTDAGFTRTTDGGLNWNVVSFGCDGTNVVFSQFNHNYAVASKGACSYFLYSTDAGASFYSSDLTGYWDGAQDWIGVIKEDPYLPGVFFWPLRDAVEKNYININISTNYGQHWYSNHDLQSQYFKPIYTGNVCQSPQAFAISEADTNILYLASVDFMPPEIGCFNQGPRLWRSMDAGQNWTELNLLNISLPIRYISSITTDPLASNIAYITLSGFGSSHVFKTYDYGNYWYDISGMGNNATELPDVPVNCLALRYISGWEKELIVGTDVGVFIAVDNEIMLPRILDWQEYADNLPSTIVLDVEIVEAADKLRCAAFGRGIYETNLSGSMSVPGNKNMVTVNKAKNEIPLEYSLSQNFPNPFNPKTKIKFSIPRNGMVKIVLYDILGNEVKTLINEIKQAGNYEIGFDASQISSGVYVYKMTSGDYQSSKKMTVIK